MGERLVLRRSGVGRRQLWFVVVVALVAVTWSLGGATARAGSATTPVRVSDAGPAPCADLLPPPPRGSNQEVSVASDPSAPERLVAAWMINGATGVETAWSDDRGRSWHLSLVPGYSECAGREQGVVHDPWVAIGPDGLVYLVFKPGVAGGLASGISVTTSADHGVTWSMPVVVQPNNGLFNDKPSIVADPVVPGSAYVSWNAAAGAVVNAAGAIMTSRTVDAGLTWSAPATTRSSPPNARELPHLVAFGDGTIENLIASLPPVEAATANSHVTVVAVRSKDHGETWTTAPTACAYQGSPIFGAATRGTDAWIAYAQNTSGTAGDTSIATVHTENGGASWSSPIEVTPFAGSSFPMVAVTPAGVSIGFFDQRNAPTAGASSFDVWVRHSSDAGRSWSEDHLDGPFNGPGRGDYQNAAAVAGGVGFAYARPSVAPQTEPTDVYFTLTSSDGRARDTPQRGAEPTADVGSRSSLPATGGAQSLAPPAGALAAAVALRAARRRTAPQKPD